MPLVNKRYAEALIEITEDNGSTDEVIDNFRKVAALFEESWDFRLFLLDPKVQAESKKEVLKDAFESRVRCELLNFLFLLIDKGRTRYIPGILDEYIGLADMKKNVLNLKIISAVPLEETQVNKIKEKYMKLYGKNNAKAEIHIDKSLIGGIRIQIGDKVIDDSIKARLMDLKEIMLKQ
ncbi:MAG: F0F1 ATP synthase subunit delta [Bacillota bacterium]